MSRWHRAVAMVLLLGRFGAVHSASAEEGAVSESRRERARRLGYAGARADAEGRPAEANEYFARAYRLMPVPTLGLAEARTLAKLGRLLEAEARLVEVNREPLTERRAAEAQLDLVVQRRAQADAQAEAQRLEARIPTLVLAVEGASRVGLEVSVDGTPKPPSRGGNAWRMDPGPHRIVVSSGSAHAELELTLSEAEHQIVPVRLLEDRPRSSSDLQTAGIVIGASGVVTLGIGTYLLAQFFSGHADYAKRCTHAAPDRATYCGKAHDYLQAKRNGGLGLGAASAVLIATGVTLVTWRGDAAPEGPAPSMSAALDIGRRAVGARLRGTF